LPGQNSTWIIRDGDDPALPLVTEMNAWSPHFGSYQTVVPHGKRGAIALDGDYANPAAKGTSPAGRGPPGEISAR